MSKTTKPDLLGVEPIDYVYRGSDGLIYRTIPQDVPVIETIPRYSAATVERLVQERDIAKHNEQCTHNANKLMASQLFAAQAREQQLRKLLNEISTLGAATYYDAKDIADDALAIPQDNSALRQYVRSEQAKLLREIVPQMEYNGCGWTSEHELRRKADELEEKK